MSLVMLCFPCCDEEQPPPRRRPKIDRSMIGEPMGFKHTGHIGSGELSGGFDIHNVQDQMQSKGGYEYTCALSEVEPDGIDLKKDSPTEDDSVDVKKDSPTEDSGNQTEQPNGLTEQSKESNTVETAQPNRTDDESNQL